MAAIRHEVTRFCLFSVTLADDLLGVVIHDDNTGRSYPVRADAAWDDWAWYIARGQRVVVLYHNTDREFAMPLGEKGDCPSCGRRTMLWRIEDEDARPRRRTWQTCRYCGTGCNPRGE